MNTRAGPEGDCGSGWKVGFLQVQHEEEHVQEESARSLLAPWRWTGGTQITGSSCAAAVRWAERCRLRTDSMSVIAAAEKLRRERAKTMAARTKAEQRVSASLANADDDMEPAPRTCCFPFLGGSRRYTDLARSQANAKLSRTAEQLALRVSDLAARVASARNTAASLNAAGKKTEALAALRRSKAIEKQLAASQTALESLETQLLMLEDAKLQAEISTALAASTGDFKKTTRGLLKKTEKAVDDAAEVKDLAEDVHSALDGLKQSEFDEDDLLAELEEMQAPKESKNAASHGTITFTLPSVPRGDVTVREAGGVMLAQ